MTNTDKCLVCNTTLASKVDLAIANFNCPQCGKFQISYPPCGDGASRNSYNELENLNPKERANVSGLIRENQNLGEEFLLTVDLIDKFKRQHHPHIFEKANKLLLHFDKQTKYAGQWLDYLKKQDELMGISWAVRSEGNDPYKELSYILNNYLWLTKKFLEIRKEGEANHNANPGQFWRLDEFRISSLGHAYIQTLKTPIKDSNQGFCAMWFGGKNKKDKYDKLWENAIRPAIKNAGYKELRIDKKDHINDINDEMLMEIRRSRFMVCDFNHQCNGVYFEAGFALGLGLPVIWTCEQSELKQLHFDINHNNFLTWTEDKLEDFSVRLHKRIEAILGHGKNSEE